MIRLSASAISDWRACQRRHHYAYDLRIRPNVEKESFRLGTTWHSIHEDLTEVPNDGVVDALTEYMEIAYDNCPPYVSPTQWDTERAMFFAAYRAYRDYFDEPQEIISVEEKYELPLRNPKTNKHIQDAVIVARIDKIIATNGRLAIKEYKTTSKNLTSSDYWDNLAGKIQTRLYMYVAHRLIEEGLLPDDMFISEVQYDVFSKPGIRPKKPAGKDIAYDEHTDCYEYYGTFIGSDWFDTEFETPDMYGARLYADMKSYPEKYFARRSVAVPLSEINGLEVELYNLYRQMKHVKQFGLWDANPDSCIATYKCQYCPLCLSNWDESDVLPSNFTDERI